MLLKLPGIHRISPGKQKYPALNASSTGLRNALVVEKHINMHLQCPETSPSQVNLYGTLITDGTIA